MQIAVCRQEADEGTYQYAPVKYAENILVSKTPRKNADFSSPALAHPSSGGRNVGNAAIIPGPIMSGKKAKLLPQALLGNGEQLLPKRRTQLLD